MNRHWIFTIIVSTLLCCALCGPIDQPLKAVKTETLTPIEKTQNDEPNGLIREKRQEMVCV